MINRLYMLLIQKWISWVIGAFIMAVTITVFVIYTYPLDVLKDWKITVNSNHPYVVGETIIATSEFTKTRRANATSVRYLECQADNEQTAVLYPVSEAMPLASVAAGEHTVEVPVIIRAVPHPSTCRVVIEADYRVWVIRTFTEVNRSNTFRVQ